MLRLTLFRMCRKKELIFSVINKQIRQFYSTRRTKSDTIFSLSSGSGKCGVAVIRISGNNAKLSMDKMCGGVTKARIASLKNLNDPTTKEILDKALVIWFPGPNSFTGEDTAEFHVHGGPAVIFSVLSALGSIPGLRPATPGEFAKQAFLNGKLDLTEIEGLGDLIHAETEAQRKQALRQMDGALSNLYNQWRKRLIKCLANTAAYIDFSEEENIEENILDDVFLEVNSIKNEILQHLSDSRRGERLRDGLHLVILGEPNVGKSSLLNVLSQRPAAIVSPIAGTTRDIVETALNIAGYPVLLSDTAGLRKTSDIVEKEGIKRALNRAKSADLKILVIDPCIFEQASIKASSFKDYFTSYIENMLQDPDHLTKAAFHKNSPSFTFSDAQNNHLSESIPLAECDNYVDLSNVIIVLNKIDLAKWTLKSRLLQDFNENLCCLSCTTEEGIENFMNVLVERIQKLCGNPSESNPSLTQVRHRHHLNKCFSHLNECGKYSQDDIVLASEQLRLAANEIGHITGVITGEDVLNVIFRDFCIGK